MIQQTKTCLLGTENMVVSKEHRSQADMVVRVMDITRLHIITLPIRRIDTRVSNMTATRCLLITTPLTPILTQETTPIDRQKRYMTIRECQLYNLVTRGVIRKKVTQTKDMTTKCISILGIISRTMGSKCRMVRRARFGRRGERQWR